MSTWGERLDKESQNGTNTKSFSELMEDNLKKVNNIISHTDTQRYSEGVNNNSHNDLGKSNKLDIILDEIQRLNTNIEKLISLILE